MKKLIQISIFIFALLGLYSLTHTIYAASTTKSQYIVMHPNLKLYTYVYVQYWYTNRNAVFDVEADAWAPVSSYTYANTDVAIPVDSASYVGQLNIPVKLQGMEIAFRIMGSTDATPDKDDTQITSGILTPNSNGLDLYTGSYILY